jgi:tol-pal system protein YbgF
MSLTRITGLLTLCLLLAGCVVTQQDLQMQRDLMEMKRRLGDAERSLQELQDDRSGGVRARVDTLARNQADFQAALDGIRVDLQSIQGSSGDQARANDDLRQELTLLRDELRLQLADYDARLARLEGAAPAAAAATDAGVASAEPPAASAAPTVVQAPSSAPAAAISAAPTPFAESAPGLYEQALKTIREERDFAAGREQMETFLKRYPKHELAVNAAYWIGESYYAEKRFDLAILKFEEVIETYDDHPKVAAAMYKQALAFEATGDKATTQLLLQRVIELFPLSEEAGKAKQKLLEQASPGESAAVPKKG